MLFFLFFIFFISFSHSTYDCRIRTQLFKNAGQNNDNYYYFIPESFVPLHDSYNICTNMSRKDQIEYYMKIVSKNINCSFSHCFQGKWEVIFDDTNTKGVNYVKNPLLYSYEPTFIIPKTHNISEIDGCNTEIYGNLIMSYGFW